MKMSQNKFQRHFKISGMLMGFMGILIFLFQNCSKVAVNDVRASVSSIASVNSCYPGSVEAMDQKSGRCERTCQKDSTWGRCIFFSCESDYQLAAGVCNPRPCKPKSVETCEGTDGTGYKTCADDGSAFSSCYLTKCSSGFNPFNGTCRTNSCVPNQGGYTCTDAKGTGTRTCNDLGNDFGDCGQPYSLCNAGYYRNGNDCLLMGCSPNAILNNCDVVSGNTKVGVGTATCPASGSAWGTCNLTHCTFTKVPEPQYQVPINTVGYNAYQLGHTSCAFFQGQTFPVRVRAFCERIEGRCQANGYQRVSTGQYLWDTSELPIQNGYTCNSASDTDPLNAYDNSLQSCP